MIRINDSVIPATPVADHREKEGHAVTIANGVATVVSSATTVPDGVILNGENTDGQDSVQLFVGCDKVIDVKLGGAATAMGLGVTDTAGKFLDDPGSGNRVQCVKFLQSGVSGDLVKAILFKPASLS